MALVNVVRCINCIHWRPLPNIKTIGVCTWISHKTYTSSITENGSISNKYTYHTFNTKADFYCAYGKVKEKNNET